MAGPGSSDRGCHKVGRPGTWLRSKRRSRHAERLWRCSRATAACGPGARGSLRALPRAYGRAASSEPPAPPAPAPPHRGQCATPSEAKSSRK